MKYIVTVKVRFSVNACDPSTAYKIAKEKATDLADIVGDCGAFETEASEQTPLDYDQHDD